MIEGLAYGMIIGMSAAFLWFFSNIARYGTHLIQEPNVIVLVLEIVFLFTIFVFGVVRLINLLRG